MRAALLVILVGCATGAEQSVGGDDVGDPPDAAADDDPRPDARRSPDAADDPPPDAEEEPPPDAEVELPPDAEVTGPFCFSNAECPAADDCCIGFGPGNPGFCGPGTEIGDYCLPDG
jgi:hypothetical protein